MSYKPVDDCSIYICVCVSLGLLCSSSRLAVYLSSTYARMYLLNSFGKPHSHKKLKEEHIISRFTIFWTLITTSSSFVVCHRSGSIQ
jgi:hypothetical protein